MPSPLPSLTPKNLKKRLGRAVDFSDGPPQAFFSVALMFDGQPKRQF